MESYGAFAAVYDRLMLESFDYEAWCDGLIRFLPEGTRSILDVGAGTGLLTAEFLKRGYQVTALDPSAEMLALLEDRTRSFGNQITILQGAFPKLSFLPSFDAVLMTCDVLNYVLKKQEVKKGFHQIYNLLKAGGVFLFDTVTEKKLKDMLGNRTLSYVGEEVTYLWENQYEKGYLDSFLTFFVKEGALYRRFEEIHSQRFYEKAFIKKALTEAGFQRIKHFCAFREERPVTKNTVRIQWVAAK